jgi:hypothetical protein
VSNATGSVLSSRLRWIAGIGAGAVVLLAVAGLFLATRGGCSSREDVIASVGLVSSAFQEAAAQERIKVEDLASGVKRMNEAATAYETSSDHQAYCDALDKLKAEYELAE